MKSVCASGRLPHFCWRAPMPLPKRPPLAMPKMPWPLCQPAPWKSRNGSTKLVSRSTAARCWCVARNSATTLTMVTAPTNSRAGAPTTQSMPRMIANSTSAVPRSPPSTTTRPVTSATHGHHRDQRVLPVAEQPLLAGVDVRAPEDQRELGDLGRLDLRTAAEGEPVAVAVDRDAERGLGQRDQQQATTIEGQANAAQQPVRQPGRHERDRQRRARPRSAAGRTSSSCCRTACTTRRWRR